ncbi:MAG: hypothetical protein DMG59_04785 [Acidobacteria bacterium]|nr:MAG: hypothetical protein DMG59_04785 [Acidobacteriota bacterium]
MEEQKQTAAQSEHGCFFCTVAGPQIEALLNHCWPEPTQEHFRNARIEVLKGIRSLLDARIERLAKRAQKGTKLVVE